jgi:hypothetical protein
MNTQSHTSTSHAMAASNAYVMMQPSEEDAMDVIREATYRQSRLLSADAPVPSAALHEARSEAPSSIAAGATEAQRSWSLAAFALVTVIALGVGDSLLLSHHAQPAVQAAPLAQVLDLSQ